MTTFNKSLVLAIISNTTMLTVALFLRSPREEVEQWDIALAVHDPLRHHRRSELVKFQHLLRDTTLDRPPFMRCVLNYLAHALYTRASVCTRKSRIAERSDDTVNHSAKWLWVGALSYLLVTGMNLNLPVIATDKSQKKNSPIKKLQQITFQRHFNYSRSINLSVPELKFTVRSHICVYLCVCLGVCVWMGTLKDGKDTCIYCLVDNSEFLWR